MDKQDLFSLKGKVAIVTGACGLLGTEHCKALAEAGAYVVVADINRSACEKVTIQLGNDHLAIAVDVTSTESLVDARKKILDKYGRIDVW